MLVDIVEENEVSSNKHKNVGKIKNKMIEILVKSNIMKFALVSI